MFIVSKNALRLVQSFISLYHQQHVLSNQTLQLLDFVQLAGIRNL